MAMTTILHIKRLTPYVTIFIASLALFPVTGFLYEDSRRPSTVGGNLLLLLPRIIPVVCALLLVQMLRPSQDVPTKPELLFWKLAAVCGGASVVTLALAIISNYILV